MKQIIEFEFEDGASIFVEEEIAKPIGSTNRTTRGSKEIQKSRHKFEEAIDKLRPVSEKLITRLSELAKSPNEIEVEFGFKLSGAAGFVLTSASTEANFKVKLVWK